MVHAEMAKCQNCSFPLEIKILGICSGLGPSKVLCRKCGQVLETNRTEWPLDSGKQQAYLLLIFFAYLSLGFVIGAELFSSAEASWKSQSYEKFAFTDPHYQKMGWVGVGLVLLMLFNKVLKSVTRKPLDSESPLSRANMFQFNFIFGGHLKALIIFLLPQLFVLIYRWIGSARS